MIGNQLDRQRRWVATAGTWFAKAAALLGRQAESARNDDERWLVAYDAEALLRKVIFDAELLVDLIDAERLEEVERYAAALSKRIKNRRLAAKLNNVEGRTPQEAELFRARAAELARG